MLPTAAANQTEIFRNIYYFETCLEWGLDDQVIYLEILRGGQWYFWTQRRLRALKI